MQPRATRPGRLSTTVHCLLLSALFGPRPLQTTSITLVGLLEPVFPQGSGTGHKDIQRKQSEKTGHGAHEPNASVQIHGHRLIMRLPTTAERRGASRGGLIPKSRQVVAVLPFADDFAPPSRRLRPPSKSRDYSIVLFSFPSFVGTF